MVCQQVVQQKLPYLIIAKLIRNPKYSLIEVVTTSKIVKKETDDLQIKKIRSASTITSRNNI